MKIKHPVSAFVYLVLAVLLGFVFGRLYSGDGAFLQTSVVGGVLDDQLQVETVGDNDSNKQEVSVGKMSDFVKQNQAGYVDEDGVIHYTAE